MKKYEKPMVVLDVDAAEGVFMASGQSGDSGGGSSDGSGGASAATCQSQYMQGVFHPQDNSIAYGSPNYTYMNVCGCEGCAASAGSYCQLTNASWASNDGLADAANGTLKPSWEQQGKSPDAQAWS